MIEFEFHADAFLITPCLAVFDRPCEDCGAEHLCLSLGWLCFTVYFVFTPSEPLNPV
jgi:hypothetical protein